VAMRKAANILAYLLELVYRRRLEKNSVR